MADVFISYSKKDENVARLISERLRAAGFSVWWDNRIMPGNTWDEVIQGALDSAACVVVLWSKNSVESQWVKEEASYKRDTLVPILIEKVDPPLGFKFIQAADLCGWRGDFPHPEFSMVCQAVAKRIKNSGRPVPNPSEPARGTLPPKLPPQRTPHAPPVRPPPTPPNRAATPHPKAAKQTQVSVYAFIALTLAVAILFGLVYGGLLTETPAALLACAVLLYFLPVIVAAMRLKRNGLAVIKLNTLHGWTGIGWIRAMKEALADD
jgi:hypothetical protein